MKIILDKEQEFIVDFACEILDNDESCEELATWYKTHSSTLNLSEKIVKICAKEIARSVFSEQLENALDIEVVFDEEEEVKDNDTFKYCICSKQYNCNDIMIDCSRCKGPYHIECVGMTIDQYQHELYKEQYDWICKQTDECQMN